MTRQTTIAAALGLSDPDVIGLVSTMFGDHEVDYEIGAGEHLRDTERMRKSLEHAGITSESYVLITLPAHEWAWGGPVIDALRSIGATYLTTEQHSFDSTRFAMFLKRLPVTAIIGVSQLTAESLAALNPDLAELFDGVDLIWARPGASEILSRAGVRCMSFLPLGPALGFGAPGIDGAIVDDAEWVVEEDDGRILVSTKIERRESFTRIDTGVRGRVAVVDGKTVVVSTHV